MLSPQLYLMLALGLAVPATYGVMAVKVHRAQIAAYEQGRAAGAGAVAASTTKAAAATVAAVAAGEREAPPINKAKIVELCQKSASCRDRAR